MKTFIVLLFLSLGALSYGTLSLCNTNNYQDYINKPGNHQCNLRWADLRGVDLRDANLRGASLFRADLHDANLRGADLFLADLFLANLSSADFTDAKVDRVLATYLTSQGISGFIVVEED